VQRKSPTGPTSPAGLSDSSCQDCCMCAVSSPSTYGEVPGGAGRWTLPDVNIGLNSMADMYTQAERMANEVTLYATLQGITMHLLILRLIKLLSAQKRLSILTTTAVKVTGCLNACCPSSPPPLPILTTTAVHPHHSCPSSPPVHPHHHRRPSSPPPPSILPATAVKLTGWLHACCSLHCGA